MAIARDCGMEAVLEAPAINPRLGRAPANKFPPEIAAEMQRRSMEVRRRRIEEMELAAKEQEVADKLAAAEAAKLKGYAGKQLVRVRVQLDRLDALMAAEVDPNKLDRLASAIAKLSQLERELDGRPLPGSLKPSNKPDRRQSHALPEPEPTQGEGDLLA